MPQNSYKMIIIAFLAFTSITLCSAAPLYGQDGGYAGFSSYRPLKDGLKASAGNSDVFHYPLKKGSPSYNKKEYEAKKVANDIPYGRTYGQRIGYKLAEAYPKQHKEIKAQDEYKDKYLAPAKPYEFAYAIKDKHGNMQHRKEASDGKGTVYGSYGYKDQHGVYRTVDYVADKGGFRANVKTNEPGTDNQDPADVKIYSENY